MNKINHRDTNAFILRLPGIYIYILVSMSSQKNMIRHLCLKKNLHSNFESKTKFKI
jgi:hypothetical protein